MRIFFIGLAPSLVKLFGAWEGVYAIDETAVISSELIVIFCHYSILGGIFACKAMGRRRRRKKKKGEGKGRDKEGTYMG